MIIRNAIKTPDGTIIESKHRHDYVSHLDANGETYMVDGGKDYFRGSVNEVPATNLRLSTEDNSIEEIREVFTWGSNGVNGDQPTTYTLLKDISDNHLESIIDFLTPRVEGFYREEYRGLMEAELGYREYMKEIVGD